MSSYFLWPEFINRIDEILRFKNLDQAHMKPIAKSISTSSLSGSLVVMSRSSLVTGSWRRSHSTGMTQPLALARSVVRFSA